MKYLYEQVFFWLVRHIGDDLSSSLNQACSFIGIFLLDFVIYVGKIVSFSSMASL